MERIFGSLFGVAVVRSPVAPESPETTDGVEGAAVIACTGGGRECVCDQRFTPPKSHAGGNDERRIGVWWRR